MTAHHDTITTAAVKAAPTSDECFEPVGGNDVILVTGASGYVRNHLWRRLEEAGHKVRCLARLRESLAGRVGAATQIVDGDLLKPETLEPSVAGVETAYYVGV